MFTIFFDIWTKMSGFFSELNALGNLFIAFIIIQKYILLKKSMAIEIEFCLEIETISKQ